MTHDVLRAALLSMAAQRQSSMFCPSEVARQLRRESWRELMSPIREAAQALVEEQQLRCTQQGREVSPVAARGPIRLSAGHAQRQSHSAAPPRTVDMPAQSKKQQMAAGAALAAKRGEMSKKALQGASKSMASSMSEKQLEEFAHTKRKALPKRAGSAKSSGKKAAAKKSSAKKTKSGK